MFSESELKRLVGHLRGRIYELTAADEPIFHLVVNRTGESKKVILFKIDRGSAVVITQMHDHENIEGNTRYQQINPSDLQELSTEADTA